jgi:hypothetical protein
MPSLVSQLSLHVLAFIHCMTLFLLCPSLRLRYLLELTRYWFSSSYVGFMQMYDHFIVTCVLFFLNISRQQCFQKANSEFSGVFHVRLRAI